MSSDLLQHKNYTRQEYASLNYYHQLFDVLNTKNIKSYIDIGANIGEVCNIYFEKIPTLQKAYLFEVNPYTFELLQSNIQNKTSVELHNTAIYYGSQPPILFNKDNNIGHTMVGTNELQIVNDRVIQFGFQNDGQILNYTTLEELNIPDIDLIKIDIEGGEFNIIDNSKYLHNTKYLEIEFHHQQSNIDIDQYISKRFLNHKIILAEEYKGRFLFERNDL